MPVNKSLIVALMLLFLPLVLTAQNTNSPYSRYGYGIQEYPALGKSRAMGGISLGIRDNGMINPANPASFSAVDTMTFLFDFGVSASYSTFKENDVRQSNPNGSIDYVAMKIPLKKYWGVAAGLIPFSKVGYSYSETSDLTDDISQTNSYVGTGGLNTVFLGTSVSLWKALSLGVNYKYTFGTITQASSLVLTDESSSTDPNTKSSYEYWYLNASSLDFGLQYEQKIDKKNKFVLGAMFSENTPFNNEVYLTDVTTDTITDTHKSGFELPRTLGAGVSWTYDNRLTMGVDYYTQEWSKSLLNGSKDTLSNSSRFSFGAEYLPSLMTNHYFEAVKYRFGMYYSNTYNKFPDGELKNIGVTLGVGLPLPKQRSTLNLSFEAGRYIVPTSQYIHENYYKISLDVTFNETWFFKRKL